MKHLFDKQNKYSIRKLSVGVCSAVIGLSFLSAGNVYASETASNATTTATTTQSTPVAVDQNYGEASTALDGNPATNAVDGNNDTFWQSNPVAGSTAPQTLTVKMAEPARIDSVTYMPRQVTAQDPVAEGPEHHPSHHPGILTKGKLEYSVDGNAWQAAEITAVESAASDRSGANKPLADNTFGLGSNNHAKTIRFTPVDAQYLRLTVLESWGGRATGYGGHGIVNAATFTPSGVKPTAAPPADNGTGGNQTTPSTNQPAIIKELANERLTTANGTKIDLGEDVKNHLKTANSGTVYLEYRAPQNAPGFHGLFNASSGTVDNHYTVIYDKNGHIGMESRTVSGYNDFNTGSERVKTGEWNAVAMTYEKNPSNNQITVKLYVNGVHSLTHTGGNDLFASMTNLAHAQLGAAQRAGRGSVWGADGLEIRQFTLYSNALPEEKVLERSAQFKRKAYTLPANPGEEVSEKIAVFQAGRNGGKNAEGVGHYRIPALLVTDKGTVLAVGDQRRNHAGDWGDIAIVARRSSDQGDTWGNTIKIIDLKQNPNAPDKSKDNVLAIDSALVQDPISKRIFAFYDMYPEGAALFGMPATREGNVEYTTVNGKKYLNLYKTGEATPYTVRENGRVFTPDGVETNYRVDVDGGGFANSYADLGDLYEGDRKIDNIFFQTAKGSPFRAPNNSFMWMSYSDDDGVTWSQPRDLTPDLKADYMKFLGTGPGTGIVLHSGPHAGRLIVPAYATNWTGNLNAQSSLVFYSDDHGETWHAGESVNDNRTLANGTTLHLRDMNNLSEIKTEATVVQLKNGDLKLFARGQKGKVTMATSKDGGASWENEIVQFDDVNDVYVQLSAIRIEREGKEYVILANAEGPGRTNGHVRLAEVDAEGNLNWINHRLIQDGNFAYNSIQHLGGDDFALLYEHNGAGENTYSLYYKKFNWIFLTSPEPKLPDINVANVTFEDDNLAVLTFEDSVLPTNSPSLLLSNGNTAQFVEQRNATTLVYRIQPTDKGKMVLEVASGDISNINGPKVNVVTKLGEESNLSKVDNKAIRATAGNADAWQPGAGPDKLLDGNKGTVAELKWDMASNYINGAYPEAWRLPQTVTVSTRDGKPIDVASLLITKRTPGNGTLTKYKVEAYKGDQKVHDSGEVAVDFTKAEVAHEFASPVNADRVVLTLLEAKQNAAGQATPTMLTLRELALFGPREATREYEVTEVLAYDTITREDPSKPTTYREETEGVNGSETKLIRETLVNGLVTRKEEVGQATRVEPRHKIITIGTGSDQTTPVDPTDPTLPTDSTDPTSPVDPSDPTVPTLPVDPFDPTHPTDPTLPTDSTDPTRPADPSDPTVPTLPVDPFDPTHPTDPTLPTDSTDPTRPVDPSDPTDPTLPVDPFDPTHPTDPTLPTDSTDPTSPADPTTPTDTVKPVDPTTPTDPVKPADPTTPTDTVKPVDPTTPTDTVKPVDPTTPTDTVKPVDPTTPTDTVKPVDPTIPTDTIKPVDPTTPTDTVKPVDPTTPTDTVKPVDPTTPTGSVKPVDPTTPTGSVKPVDPTTPTDSVKPVDPTTPTGSVKPVDPTTPTGSVKPVDPTTSADAVKPAAKAPATSPASSAPTASKPTLPNTGEASSSLAILGGAALVAALGLVGVRKRED